MAHDEMSLVHNRDDMAYVNGPGGSAEPEEYQEFYETAKIVTGLFCYPIVCLVGLSGNILTLVVLCQRNMATTTNTFLTALAVADTIKLLNDVLYFGVTLLEKLDPEKGKETLAHLYPFAHYVFNMSVCVSAWLTVSVAVERYIYVCHPVRAREICTIDRARKTSLCVFTFMVLVSLPSALRYETVVELDPDTNQTTYNVQPSYIGVSHSYKVYFWLQNFLRSVIPLLILICLNTCIILSLRQTRVQGRAVSGRNRITWMLIAIVFVFLICITPDAIMSMFFGFGYYEDTNLVKGVREITDLLIQVNSAVNFIIYCSMSRAFRDTFMVMFCCRPLPISTFHTEYQSTMRSSVRRPIVRANNDGAFV
ncbi:FMRFamide receptor-like [Liolophura sinensis]|uniref:FMRFamide receptor-like n=1 Tax=Liolophura sinensis TaxID=3198878 RepID=UPI003158BCE1